MTCNSEEKVDSGFSGMLIPIHCPYLTRLRYALMKSHGVIEYHFSALILQRFFELNIKILLYFETCTGRQ